MADNEVVEQTNLFLTLVLNTATGSVQQVMINGAPAEDLFFAIAFSGRVNGSTALIPTDVSLGELLNSESIRIQEKVASVLLQQQIRQEVDRRLAELEAASNETPDDIDDISVD